MKSFLCPDCIYEVAAQCKMGQCKKTVVKNIVKALEGRWLCNPLRSEAELRVTDGKPSKSAQPKHANF